MGPGSPEIKSSLRECVLDPEQLLSPRPTHGPSPIKAAKGKARGPPRVDLLQGPFHLGEAQLLLASALSVQWGTGLSPGIWPLHFLPSALDLICRPREWGPCVHKYLPLATWHRAPVPWRRCSGSSKEKVQRGQLAWLISLRSTRKTRRPGPPTLSAPGAEPVADLSADPGQQPRRRVLGISVQRGRETSPDRHRATYTED